MRRCAIYTCIICKSNVEVDDALFTTPAGKAVCLRCYERETGTQLPMPKELRQDIANAAGRD